MQALEGNHFRLADWLLSKGAESVKRDLAGKSIYHYIYYAKKPDKPLTTEDEAARDNVYKKLHVGEFAKTISEGAKKIIYGLKTNSMT
jgi:hypothetical protein